MSIGGINEKRTKTKVRFRSCVYPADAEKSLAYEADFEYTKGNRQTVGMGGNY